MCLRKLQPYVPTSCRSQPSQQTYLIVSGAVKAASKAAPKVDVAELSGQVHSHAACMAAQSTIP